MEKYTIGSLSKELGITREGLRQWLKRHPIPERRIRLGATRVRYFTEADRQEIFRLRGVEPESEVERFIKTSKEGLLFEEANKWKEN